MIEETLAVGDVAYNGTHAWLAEADSDQRKDWIANLEKLAGMDPTTVVAGHKVPETDDNARRVLFDQTRDYVVAFDAAVGQSSSKEELVERVTGDQEGRVGRLGRRHRVSSIRSWLLAARWTAGTGRRATGWARRALAVSRSRTHPPLLEP